MILSIPCGRISPITIKRADSPVFMFGCRTCGQRDTVARRTRILPGNLRRCCEMGVRLGLSLFLPLTFDFNLLWRRRTRAPDPLVGFTRLRSLSLPKPLLGLILWSRSVLCMG